MSISTVLNKIELYPSVSDKEEIFVPEKLSCTKTKVNNIVSLRAVKVGQNVQIIHVHASGEVGRRIREMGLITGAEVSVIGRAPLKDPVALRLLGFTLTLRNNEADYIMVKIIE